uniref:Uncharacterized protein n=1 Tax=Hyaloperonospora arabidopsidis (strain Emoy2) TaxID=559515 RepID=M4C0M8_HYAAE
MVFYTQLKRRSCSERRHRVLKDDVSGRSRSGPRGGFDAELPIKQPVQLLLEDGDTGTATETIL